MRAVEEKGAALQRLAAGWTDGLPRMKEDYERRAQALLRSAEPLRHLLADKSA